MRARNGFNPTASTPLPASPEPGVTPLNDRPWVELGFKDEVKDGVYFIGGDEIWVTQAAGSRVVVSNVCPHKMGPISCGEVKGHFVRCPWHGYWFDIATGKCSPSLKLRRYETKEENGKILVRLMES